MSAAQPGDTRILRLRTWWLAQVHGLRGWVTMRRFGSRESAEEYLREREEGHHA